MKIRLRYSSSIASLGVAMRIVSAYLRDHGVASQQITPELVVQLLQHEKSCKPICAWFKDEFEGTMKAFNIAVYDAPAATTSEYSLSIGVSIKEDEHLTAFLLQCDHVTPTKS